MFVPSIQPSKNGKFWGYVSPWGHFSARGQLALKIPRASESWENYLIKQSCSPGCLVSGNVFKHFRSFQVSWENQKYSKCQNWPFFFGPSLIFNAESVLYISWRWFQLQSCSTRSLLQKWKVDYADSFPYKEATSKIPSVMHLPCKRFSGTPIVTGSANFGYVKLDLKTILPIPLLPNLDNVPSWKSRRHLTPT